MERAVGQHNGSERDAVVVDRGHSHSGLRRMGILLKHRISVFFFATIKHTTCRVNIYSQSLICCIVSKLMRKPGVTRACSGHVSRVRPCSGCWHTTGRMRGGRAAGPLEADSLSASPGPRDPPPPGVAN